VAPAVDVGDVRAAATLDEHGAATDGTPGTHGAVYPARDDLARPREELVGLPAHPRGGTGNTPYLEPQFSARTLLRLRRACPTPRAAGPGSLAPRRPRNGGGKGGPQHRRPRAGAGPACHSRGGRRPGRPARPRRAAAPAPTGHAAARRAPPAGSHPAGHAVRERVSPAGSATRSLGGDRTTPGAPRCHLPGAGRAVPRGVAPTGRSARARPARHAQ